MINKIAKITEVNDVLANKGSMITAGIEPVWKNNGLKEGVTIHASGLPVGLVIYPEESWWTAPSAYIAAELETAFMEKSISIDEKTIGNIVKREYILSHVRPRIISADNISGLEASDIVYKRCIDDIVAVFAVDVDGMEDGSVKISGKMLTHAGIDVDELYRQSLENIRNSYTFLGMEAMLGELMGADAPCSPDMQSPLFVLTNESRMYGAASVLCKDTLKSIYNMLGREEYYILPSSIHEVLIIRKSLSPAAPEELLAMVTEINAEQVLPEERLSNNVYHYDVKHGMRALF